MNRHHNAYNIYTKIFHWSIIKYYLYLKGRICNFNKWFCHVLITLKCTKFLSASVLGSIQVVSTIKDFKTFKKFQKMTWIQKNSNPYQIWIYYYSLDPKAYGTPNAVWTGKLTKEDIIKMDCESIFNTKKNTCHTPFQSII